MAQTVELATQVQELQAKLTASETARRGLSGALRVITVSSTAEAVIETASAALSKHGGGL